MSSTLSQHAVSEAVSRGRRYDEPTHRYRSAFERDRDRVIHCAAFRRLEGKTQVFTTGLNDHYRTRLTHSIEVAQIGRTLAKVLNVNESLTEAICLAHDLGHAPFGHNGEKVLNQLMKDFSGFEHNRQSLRIVDFLEHPYPDFQGLNLMYETRLGLIKHSSPYDEPDPNTDWPMQATLEGQIADVADRIAYNCHDLEDGLRSRLIDEEQLSDINLYKQAREAIHLDAISDHVIRRTRLAKTMMDILVSDVIETSLKNIENAGIQTVSQVIDHPTVLVNHSRTADAGLREIETFLMQNMYLHRNLKETADKVTQWLTTLFDALRKQPEKMPRYYQQLCETEGYERTVCDYIAGTTDRYCLTLIDQI